MKNFKGIYLAAYRALHPGYNIIYQDINGKRDLAGDMMDVDLNSYDFIIASPPCNFWSRANYRRNVSNYSQNTKHLLPGILDKLANIGKPYIVENVTNRNLMQKYCLFYKSKYVYFIGRHTYWSNIFFNFVEIKYLINCQVFDNVSHISISNRQGGKNVNTVISYFLKKIHNEE